MPKSNLSPAPLSAHTPGPWQVMQPQKIHGSDDWQGLMILSADRSTLAEVYAVDRGDAQANARLFAASPRLLASLEVLIEHVIPALVGEKLCAEVRAAIADARGAS